MKKLLLIFITIVCIILSSCDATYVVKEETGAAQTGGVATALPSQLEEDETAPSLPEMDFSGLDFFDDGYEQVKFYRITDGDTATFIMDGLIVKCRFVGIDTPELDHEGGKHEPFAQDARDFTESALKDADIIILERDEAAGEHDNYDRLLAHVWVDGELLSFLLISEGLATTRYYRDEYRYYDEISKAESLAQKDKRGVWGE